MTCRAKPSIPSAMARRLKTLITALTVSVTSASNASAGTIPLKILVPNLQVTTVVNTGISQPIGIVFLVPLPGRQEDKYAHTAKADTSIRRCNRDKVRVLFCRGLSPTRSRVRIGGYGSF
jgi:hypothetical protein